MTMRLMGWVALIALTTWGCAAPADLGGETNPAPAKAPHPEKKEPESKQDGPDAVKDAKKVSQDDDHDVDQNSIVDDDDVDNASNVKQDDPAKDPVEEEGGTSESVPVVNDPIPAPPAEASKKPLTFAVETTCYNGVIYDDEKPLEGGLAAASKLVLMLREYEYSDLYKVKKQYFVDLDNEGKTAKNSILNEGSFQATLKGVPDGDYRVFLCDASKKATCGTRSSTTTDTEMLTVGIANFVAVEKGEMKKFCTDIHEVPFMCQSSGSIPMAARYKFFTNYWPRNAPVATMNTSAFTAYRSDPRCNKAADAIVWIRFLGSPLVVDYYERGIELSSVDDGVAFDILGTGEKMRTAWPVSGSTLFLALDRNANGSIDGVAELFGDNTVGPDDAGAANGFLALEKYDDNGDRVIDSKDWIFHRLLFWSDENVDGLSEANELSRLGAMDVVAIDLAYESTAETDRHGNQIRQKSRIRLNGGATRSIVDAWFVIGK